VHMLAVRTYGRNHVSEDKTGYGRQDGIRDDGSSSGGTMSIPRTFQISALTRACAYYNGADGGLNPRKAGLRPVGS
jgi:hypothetical protein